MKTTISAASILIFALVASPLQADVVELDLLALGCPAYHDFDTSPWSFDFDLGVRFSSIQRVYMDWSGEITGGLAHDMYSPNPYPAPVMIDAHLSLYPSYRYTYANGGWTYPEPESFSEISVFRYGSMPLSELYDGKELIRIRYDEYIILDGWYVEHGSVSLSTAKLVVEGVMVPEPSSLLLMAFGAFGIRPYYKKGIRS